MMPNDKSYIPNCMVKDSDDTVPVFDTFSFNLEDKYNFKGLDDNIGRSRPTIRTANHSSSMIKPNDDAPEFRG